MFGDRPNCVVRLLNPSYALPLAGLELRQLSNSGGCTFIKLFNLVRQAKVST
uniref:Uncharacterized protein n=1 Tax=Picea glauca TaxID=3330 RepID=A0A117NHZ5_PICGL|nr:hypothetical protein ABT39_MTgene3666 [Picea glauca]